MLPLQPGNSDVLVGTRDVPRLRLYRTQYQFMIYYDSHESGDLEVMPSSYTIGAHFEHFVKEQVEGGSYASASEVIRDGLRLLEEEQQRRQAVIDGLRGEIEKGRRSGKPKPAADVLDRLERKYTKMVKERAK
jgi:antitoxin ParD1/3/4